MQTTPSDAYFDGSQAIIGLTAYVGLSRLKSGSMLLADRGYDADWMKELATKGRLGQHPAEKQPQRDDDIENAAICRPNPPG